MPLYRLGDQGSAVIEIHSLLADQGLLPRAASDGGRHSLDTSAVFDTDTDDAVRAFQQQRGLIVDGSSAPQPSGPARGLTQAGDTGTRFPSVRPDARG